MLAQILRAVVPARNKYAGPKPHLHLRASNTQMWSRTAVAAQLTALKLPGIGSPEATAGGALRLGVSLGILVEFSGEPGAFYYPVRSRPRTRRRGRLTPPRLTPARRDRTRRLIPPLRLRRSRPHQPLLRQAARPPRCVAAICCWRRRGCCADALLRAGG